MRDEHYYFAYGSNMSSRRLQQRLPEAQVVGRASLKGFQLRFHKIGYRDGSAKADAFETERAQDRIEGILYRLADAAWARLDAIEGVSHGYERCEVAVQCPRLGEVRAQTYVATSIDRALKPFAWYKRHVLEGAREHGLPDDYVAAIEALETIEDPDPSRAAGELALY